ncbi:transcription elongation factor GreA [Brucepastera parasyntrophica]|uniref:transcription elongation factor GreA n=1 Tax=Brucepastera parasyntrophica TaxID=2880008 RepID=UPI00210EAA6B|nr:transcription elongation factor GreA [Brucepastera parasyntrophica]ULQ59894.1 transcription elongation factor GreA [Brucepastera parasyntrophica]
MSESLVKTVQDMLNEEKWTRATISNYSISNFKELDDILKQAQQEKCTDEIKKLCDEHLAHTKNSIIALYLSGISALSRQLLDDSAMVSLINIFIDNHKTPIVEYLCERMLEFGESKFALRTLADCYKEDNNEKLYQIWERLVKIDYDEADIAKLLAEKYEKEGDIETAVDYYKKALYRFINRKQVSSIKEIWTHLVSLIPEEIDFFYHVQRKIAKVMGDDRSAMLLQELYTYYKNKKDWNTAIDILKLILSYDEKDSWARKEIVECFRGKYADHSQLDEYIKASNLNQSWRNVFEAIAEFEKHISFDTGNFVHHRSWGVGRIANVKNDEITIDFAKKRGHSMSLKMGVNALQTLNKDHIWVLKSIWKKEKLSEKIKKDPNWTLKVIIRSYDNCCDLKHIKAELVPSVLTPGEWTNWSSKARTILKEDPGFGVDPTNIDMYIVRDRPISVEEKLFNEFKAQKNFFSRIDILMDFSEKAEPDSEYFAEMFSYFAGYLKAFNQVNEQIIASYLVVKQIVAKHPHINPGIQYNFAELFSEIDDPSVVYLAIKDNNLKKSYLQHIKIFLPDWADYYIKLFPTVLSADIIDSLIKEGYSDKVKELAALCFENYRDYREAVIWFFKNAQDEQWFKELDIPYEKQLITLIHILDLTYREIANHRETTENRKLNRQVLGILFGKDSLLENYILQNDIGTITRLYTLVDDVKDLDPAIKMNLRNKILEKHKGFKFFGTEEKAVVSKGLIVTSKMYEVKKKQLQNIIEVEIPANSKEIGFALSLGDLRENSEYKAAKERQTILNATATRLQEEIDRAQIFDPTTTTTTRVSFGTVVSLKNNEAGEDETYTILGPWESDPDNSVISYMSPFGNAILNHREGENLKFTINDRNYDYTIKSIKAASF